MVMQLKPSIDKKNNAYQKFLQVGTMSRKSTFKKLQWLVWDAVVRVRRIGSIR